VICYRQARRAIVVGLCFVATVVEVTSCAPSDQKALIAEGLIAGDPCEPPCWQGLVPGVSTHREVIEVLEGGGYADSLEVGPGRYEAITIVTWRPKRVGWRSQHRNMFELQHGRLEVMNMYVDSEVALGEVVDRYGPPDEQTVFLSMSGPIDVVVQLFYEDLGTILQVILPEDHPELKPEDPVERLWYFEPAPLDEAMAILAGRKGEPLEDFQLQWLEYWHDWEGYGVVEADHGYP
jgi:hypothetical protein